MCHKHLDKSVLMHLFKFLFTNTKIIIQYRLTYTPCSDLNSVLSHTTERYSNHYRVCMLNDTG